GFSLQQFSFPEGVVLVGARLRLHRRPYAEIQKDIKVRLKVKKQTQPLALASAGCVWKDVAGEPAGKLIERVGLRGKRMNGAEISAAAGMGGWWFLMSPRFAVKGVDVRGAHLVSTDRILEAAQIPPGRSVFLLDPHRIARQVEALPEVQRAEVIRELPNRVTV